MFNNGLQNEYKTMWKKYGFHIRFNKPEKRFGAVKYYTQGLIYSKDYDLEMKSDLDIEVVQYIFIEIIERIDRGEQLKEGNMCCNVMGQFDIKLIREKDIIKLVIV